MYNISSISDYSIEHNISTSLTMGSFHFHDLYQIYFSLSGGIKCFVNDRIYEIEKGDVFIFSPQDLHKIVVPSNFNYERYTILFNSNFVIDINTKKTNLISCFVDRPSEFVHVRHLSEKDCSDLINLFIKAKNAYSSNKYGNDIYKKIILVEILIFINSLYKTTNLHHFSFNKSNYVKVSPVIEYINLHYNENLSLNILSAKFYISKYYMGNLFKNTTGFTINEYIIHKKIIKAQELLRENIQVSQVCDMVGFHNESHFIRTFKKFVGISPKQYSKIS